MNKLLFRIIGGTILLLILTFIMIPVYDNRLHEQEDFRLPSRLSSYSDMGYYKIDPETILASLERGDANVFMPLLTDPRDVEEITDISISWTQADFLKIASSLGQFAWDDPMDLLDWSVYSITFEGSCDNYVGLDYAKITYFKTGRMTYTTRLIEIHPYFGWIGWGNGATYTKPLLQKWNSVDLPEAKITADEALRIASEDAKKRYQLKGNCGVLMSTSQSNDPQNWYLHFFESPGFTYIVDLDTGKYTFQKLNE